MILLEQLNPQLLRGDLKRLIIHANAVIETSQAMLDGKNVPLNDVQETDLRTLIKKAQFLLDSANDLLILESEQLVSLMVDENLQSAIHKRLLVADFSPRLKNDFGASINSIIGFSQVLLKGIDGSITEGQQNSLVHIEENGRKSLQILHQIFSSWTIEDIVDNAALHFEEINLKKMIDRFVNWVKKCGRAEIVRNGIDGSIPIWSDMIKLHSVIHFTTSALSQRFTQGKIIFNADLSREEVTIRIKNKGFTFSEFTIEELEKVRSSGDLLSNVPPIPLYNEIFDLGISRLLVETLGGEIHLEKAETSAIVTFALPVK